MNIDDVEELINEKLDITNIVLVLLVLYLHLESFTQYGYSKIKFK